MSKDQVDEAKKILKGATPKAAQIYLAKYIGKENPDIPDTEGRSHRTVSSMSQDVNLVAE
jgi:hypothetical protein